MCENCGHPHPEFDDIAPEILFMDLATIELQKLEEEKPDNGFSDSINPFVVDYFARQYANNTVEPWMNHSLSEGKTAFDAVHKLASSTFTIGFSVAMMTFKHFQESYPGIWPQIEFPSDEDVSAFVEDQKKMLAELESKTAPTPEQIKEALIAAGIDIPDNLTILGLNSLGQPIMKEGDKKQTGKNDDPGLYL
jgi:hypothetical protein